VLSVGQCGFDHAGIVRRLNAICEAETVAANSARTALDLLRAGGFDLVLVNRVFDADGASGLDLIRSLKSNADLSDTQIMLVSNYESAQSEAIEHGALPGFGKSDLNSAETAVKIRAVLTPVVKPV